MKLLKKTARKLVDGVVSKHQSRTFAQAFEKFRREPTDRSLYADLLYGWGSDGWAASEDYIADCVETFLARPGPVLECGSGITTVLVGCLADAANTSVWSLEHHTHWGQRTERYLERCGVNSVRLCISPLKSYGEFDWYDPPLSRLPDSFNLVICDGPPSITRGGRYGLVPTMRKYLSGATVLLDDVNRSEEREVADRWASELDSSFQVLGPSGHQHVVLRVPG